MKKNTDMGDRKWKLSKLDKVANFLPSFLPSLSFSYFVVYNENKKLRNV